MRKLFIITIFFAIATLSQGQITIKDKIVEDFAFIENSTDTSSLKFIRTFKCISKKGDDIPSLFRAIKVQAKNLGANCFKYKSFTRDSIIGTMTLTLDTYLGDEKILATNFYSHEKNAVFIFSDDKFNEKRYSFSVNKIKKTIKSGTYFKQTIEQGGKVKLNKGGFFGTSVTVKWDTDDFCRYFTMKGFGLSDMPISPYSPYGNMGVGAGISFTTGKLKYMDNDLGRLLAVILKRQE